MTHVATVREVLGGVGSVRQSLLRLEVRYEDQSGPPPEVIDAGRVRDPREPSAQCRPAGERPQAAEGLDVGVLESIVGLVRIAEQVIGERSEPGVVVLDQGGEDAATAARAVARMADETSVPAAP